MLSASAHPVDCNVFRTGQSWCDPNSVQARTYAIEVEPGATLTKGPFKAKTVPVRVASNYVILSV